MKKLTLAFFLLSSLISKSQILRSNTIITSDISIETLINIDDNIAEFTFSGPENRYYAIGFDATQMSDNPYIFITQDNDIQERTLGNRSAGTLLTPSTTIISDEITSGERIIKFSRPLTGPNTNYFDFSTITDGSSINIIWSLGDTFNLVYHGGSTRGTSSITFNADPSLSIDDITTRTDASNVILYPIPMKDVLNITNVKKIKTIDIYNLTYQKIKSFSKEQITNAINLSDLPPSTYFIKVIGNDGFNTTSTVIKE